VNIVISVFAKQGNVGRAEHLAVEIVTGICVLAPLRTFCSSLLESHPWHPLHRCTINCAQKPACSQLKDLFPYTLPRSDEIDGYRLWLETKDAAKVVADGGCLRYWLEQMPRLGLDPDVLSFNAVIDACARAGEVDRAEDYQPGTTVESLSRGIDLR